VNSSWIISWGYGKTKNWGLTFNSFTCVKCRPLTVFNHCCKQNLTLHDLNCLWYHHKTCSVGVREKNCFFSDAMLTALASLESKYWAARSSDCMLPSNRTENYAKIDRSDKQRLICLVSWFSWRDAHLRATAINYRTARCSNHYYGVGHAVFRFFDVGAQILVKCKQVHWFKKILGLIES